MALAQHRPCTAYRESIQRESFGAPRWIVLPNFTEAPVTELSEVCSELRARLPDEIQNLEMISHAIHELKKFLGLLSKVERELLPRKKQRALEEMEIVVERFVLTISGQQDQEAVDPIGIF